MLPKVYEDGGGECIIVRHHMFAATWNKTHRDAVLYFLATYAKDSLFSLQSFNKNGFAQSLGNHWLRKFFSTDHNGLSTINFFFSNLPKEN